MEPTVTVGNARLFHADCRDVLRSLADNSIHSVVCDPPYALVSIVKRFGKPGSAPAKDVYGRGAAGFMGKQWDTGEVAFSEEFWAEVLRVLKPGGHVVAFSGTRTYHRMAVAIEDAGFEIRDQLGWLYGSGFPKSHDVSKGIDKKRDDRADIIKVTTFMADAADAAGISRADVDSHMGTSDMGGWWLSRLQHRCACPTPEQYARLKEFLSLSDEKDGDVARLNERKGEWGEAAKVRGTIETTGGLHGGSGNTVGSFTGQQLAPDAVLPEAVQWQGWGTALKPAWEPICLARKPLIGTVAENVLEHGTGAINIDGSRVPGGNEHQLGRWPANIVHDGSDEVVAAFPDREGATSNGRKGAQGLYEDGIGSSAQKPGYADSGSAARFFYCAKASRADRDAGLATFETKTVDVLAGHRSRRMEEVKRPDGAPPATGKNTHPTVKPTSLMQWLCRLVTPPGGTILDPFMGSGSTGKSAVLEGFQFIGCEREDEYMPIAQARIQWAVDELQRPAVAQAQPAAKVADNDNRPADLFSTVAA